MSWDDSDSGGGWDAVDSWEASEDAEPGFDLQRYCSKPYRRWRAPVPLTFAEAQFIAMQRSREAAADYNHPARRSTILGIMRGHKLEQWEEHKRSCEDAGHPPPDDDDAVRRNPLWPHGYGLAIACATLAAAAALFFFTRTKDA